MKYFCLIILLATGGGFGLRAQTNTPVSVTATNRPEAETQPARAPTRIDSDRVDFDMTARQAIYRGNVRVNDPQMNLTCAYLVADLPQAGAHMNHIVAETNVVIDFMDDKGETNHATSDKAIYDYDVQDAVTNETVTLTGHAQVENVQGTLTGEPIVWDRANNHFSAVNETMVFRQSLDSALTKTNPPTTGTNQLSEPE